jgi:hypothetical protein
MPTNDKRAWVASVLGVELTGATQKSSNEAALHDLLAGLGDSLRELRAANAPELATLLAAFKSVSANLAAANAAEHVEELAAAVAQALGAARQREAQSAPRLTIDARKLLVTWHTAQSAVVSNIASLGQTILARDDVKRDPRLPKVQEVVASLPKLVPDFGTALDDLFNKAVNTGSMDGIASDALVVIADYRTKLSGAAKLLSLQDFASKDLGTNARLVTALSDALGELERELKAA